MTGSWMLLSGANHAEATVVVAVVRFVVAPERNIAGVGITVPAATTDYAVRVGRKAGSAHFLLNNVQVKYRINIVIHQESVSGQT